MNSYRETLSWLYALQAARGMDFKLERVALVLQRLGDPQRSFRTLHVGGTNGKGSVAAILRSILDHAGYVTGLYVSPHLRRFTERIQVGGLEIAREDVVELTREVQNVAGGSGVDLTFFEFTTVLALIHFARRGVEVGVIEVGLGGRLDATNVIEPEVAVVTSVGRDHTRFLGSSLEEIAAEKAGIIKSGRPVVIGRLPAVAGGVLRRIAGERGARLVEAGRDFHVTGDKVLNFDGLGWSVPRLRLSLAGSFQRDNAATALATLAVADDRFHVSADAVRNGLHAVRWPGRFELLPGRPLIVLDGAHNVDAVRTLVANLRPLARGRRVHLLFAVMEDKEWVAMARILGPLCASATVTRVFPPRGAEPEGPARELRRYCATRCRQNPGEAWREVLFHARPEDVVVVTGSLFLIGEIYEYRGADAALSVAAPGRG